MSRRTGLRSALVAGLIAVSLTQGVSAETIYDQGKRIYTTYIKPASNPYTAYKNLSDSQSKAVTAYLKRSKVVKVNYAPSITASRRTVWTGATITQSTVYCYDQEFLVRGEGYLGNDLYSFRQHAYWCWSNGKITSGRFVRTGSTHALFWEYKGITDSESWGGVGSDRIGRYSQAKFQICVIAFDVGCIQSDNPWISQEMSARSTGVESGGL